MKTRKRWNKLFDAKSKLTEEERNRVISFFESHHFEGAGSLKNWLGDRTMDYASDDLTDEMKEALVIYHSLTGAEFKPHTFLHPSLDEQFVRGLALKFGSKESFREYVRKENSLMPHAAYAAWLYRMIPRERFQEISDRAGPRVHKIKFKKFKEKRKKRGS